MRLQSMAVLVSLFLSLGPGPVENFLKAVWENEADQIDPWGRPTAGEAGIIDPLGGSGR
jgi:hypothetical protein